MAITIIQERKKQRYLILALTAIIFVILLVVWLGFSKKKETILPASFPATVFAIPTMEIDWQTLDNFRAKTLGTFEEISAFRGDFGRKNPFIPF